MMGAEIWNKFLLDRSHNIKRSTAPMRRVYIPENSLLAG